ADRILPQTLHRPPRSGAQGQPGLDLTDARAQVGGEAAHRQRRDRHRVPDHDPGDGDDGLELPVDEPERQDQRQGHERTDDDSHDGADRPAGQISGASQRGQRGGGEHEADEGGQRPPGVERALQDEGDEGQLDDRAHDRDDRQPAEPHLGEPEDDNGGSHEHDDAEEEGQKLVDRHRVSLRGRGSVYEAEGQSTRPAIGSSSMMAVNTSSASGALTTRLGFSGAGAQGMISKVISASGTEEAVEAKEASAETESRSSSTRRDEVTASRNT